MGAHGCMELAAAVAQLHLGPAILLARLAQSVHVARRCCSTALHAFVAAAARVSSAFSPES